jgi:hypothetical protein
VRLESPFGLEDASTVTTSLVMFANTFRWLMHEFKSMHRSIPSWSFALKIASTIICSEVLRFISELCWGLWPSSSSHLDSHFLNVGRHRPLAQSL